VFVKFGKEADAAATQESWNNLVVGGSKLSVVGLGADNGEWLEHAVAAEQALQNTLEALQDHGMASDMETFLHNVLLMDDD
jgi:hypothetical protein